MRMTGGEWAGRLAVPQNAFLNEGPFFFDPKEAATWQAIDTTAPKNGVTRVLTEFSTASLHPNFPPRTGVAKMGTTVLPGTDNGAGKRSWFGITGIVADDAGATPADRLDPFVSLYEPSRPAASTNDVWQLFSEWLSGAVGRWIADESRPGDVAILNWLIAQKLLSNDNASLPEAARLVQRYREIEARIDFPRSLVSMDERAVEPVNYRLNLRGDVYQEGDEVRRDFLEVFAGQHNVRESKGSGRLELARYLASRDNPQTARVYVNRVWQWIFGTGIVDTPSDFGRLGGRPSHPELLDWLAIRFMEDGWSTKTLVRHLVSSHAFRQSGEANPGGSERDAGNRLLHHYPTRRLEAEAIRDSLLAVSGRLDPTLGGRPINPPRPVEDARKRLFSGPLDGDGRRSLYLTMAIMQPPEFLVGFNLPDLKLPTGRRDVTNVPSQALVMLNDPFVVAMAEHWADGLLRERHPDPEARVGAMFLTAFGRPATDEEVKRWSAAAESFTEGNNLMDDRNAWTEVAHALFNTKEFLYYR